MDTEPLVVSAFAARAAPDGDSEGECGMGGVRRLAAHLAALAAADQRLAAGGLAAAAPGAEARKRSMQQARGWMHLAVAPLIASAVATKDTASLCAILAAVASTEGSGAEAAAERTMEAEAAVAAFAALLAKAFAGPLLALAHCFPLLQAEGTGSGSGTPFALGLQETCTALADMDTSLAAGGASKDEDSADAGLHAYRKLLDMTATARMSAHQQPPTPQSLTASSAFECLRRDIADILLPAASASTASEGLSFASFAAQWHAAALRLCRNALSEASVVFAGSSAGMQVFAEALSASLFGSAPAIAAAAALQNAVVSMTQYAPSFLEARLGLSASVSASASASFLGSPVRPSRSVGDDSTNGMQRPMALADLGSMSSRASDLDRDPSIDLAAVMQRRATVLFLATAWALPSPSAASASGPSVPGLLASGGSAWGYRVESAPMSVSLLREGSRVRALMQESGYQRLHAFFQRCVEDKRGAADAGSLSAAWAGAVDEPASVPAAAAAVSNAGASPLVPALLLLPIAAATFSVFRDAIGTALGSSASVAGPSDSLADRVLTGLLAPLVPYVQRFPEYAARLLPPGLATGRTLPSAAPVHQQGTAEAWALAGSIANVVSLALQQASAAAAPTATAALFNTLDTTLSAAVSGPFFAAVSFAHYTGSTAGTGSQGINGVSNGTISGSDRDVADIKEAFGAVSAAAANLFSLSSALTSSVKTPAIVVLLETQAQEQLARLSAVVSSLQGRLAAAAAQSQTSTAGLSVKKSTGAAVGSKPRDWLDEDTPVAASAGSVASASSSSSSAQTAITEELKQLRERHWAALNATVEITAFLRAFASAAGVLVVDADAEARASAAETTQPATEWGLVQHTLVRASASAFNAGTERTSSSQLSDWATRFQSLLGTNGSPPLVLPRLLECAPGILWSQLTRPLNATLFQSFRSFFDLLLCSIAQAVAGVAQGGGTAKAGSAVSAPPGASTSAWCKSGVPLRSVAKATRLRQSTGLRTAKEEEAGMDGDEFDQQLGLKREARKAGGENASDDEDDEDDASEGYSLEPSAYIMAISDQLLRIAQLFSPNLHPFAMAASATVPISPATGSRDLNRAAFGLPLCALPMAPSSASSVSAAKEPSIAMRMDPAFQSATIPLTWHIASRAEVVTKLLPLLGSLEMLSAYSRVVSRTKASSAPGTSAGQHKQQTFALIRSALAAFAPPQASDSAIAGQGPSSQLPPPMVSALGHPGSVIAPWVRSHILRRAESVSPTEPTAAEPVPLTDEVVTEYCTAEASLWIGAIVRGTIALLLCEFAGIRALDRTGVKQLSTDIAYLASVLRAIGIEPDPLLVCVPDVLVATS
jgi:hypothetical protein